jgi:hypothetical protein
MRPEQRLGGTLADHRWRARSQMTQTSVSDPFAVNPIRRSAGLVVTCLAILVLPWMISERFGTTMMLATGWLAVTGLVLGLPILIWCCGEWMVERIQRRMHPGIELLGLSPRVEHILARHGILTIREVDAMDDQSLLLLSNMDQRGAREVRRAVSIWKYRRWQESGFTAVENK